MSKLISKLLQAEESLFSLALKQLETTTGKPSIDVKLTADLMSINSKVIKDLRLDPADTTGEELYRALQVKLLQDEEELLAVLGAARQMSPIEINNLIANKIENIKIDRKGWFIKKSVAKELLKKLPPKKVMATLNYKSIDSMLKTENVSYILCAARLTESKMWLNKLIKEYGNLKPVDFEIRNIELIVLPDIWSKFTQLFVAEKGHFVIHLKEYGVLALAPLKNHNKGMVITGLALTLHYINEIKMYSSYFKLHQVRKNFNKIMIETLKAGHPCAAIAHGQKVHWRVIQRHYGNSSDKHPEIFEPHVQPEDINWQKTEQMLVNIDPSLEWWQDLDYAGYQFNDDTTSLNLIDNAISLYNNNDYAYSCKTHFRNSLWNEIFMRYMGEYMFEELVMQQLGRGIIEPELVGNKKFRSL